MVIKIMAGRILIGVERVQWQPERFLSALLIRRHQAGEISADRDEHPCQELPAHSLTVWGSGASWTWL